MKDSLLVCATCSTFDTAFSCFRSESFQICQHVDIRQHKWPLWHIWLVNASQILSLKKITNFLNFYNELVEEEKRSPCSDEEWVKKLGSHWWGCWAPSSVLKNYKLWPGRIWISFYFSLCAPGVQESKQLEPLVDYFIMDCFVTWFCLQTWTKFLMQNIC